LGEVDLVAVAGLDVALDLVERCVLLGLRSPSIGASSLKSPVVVVASNRLIRRCRSRCQARVKHQLAGAAQVIADQCPGIQAQLRVRQAEVVHGLAWQVFQAAAEVVAQVADQAAGKGSSTPLGKSAWPSCVRFPQALQEDAAASSGCAAVVASGQALSRSKRPRSAPGRALSSRIAPGAWRRPAK
jgi:hypothetical protein